MADKTSLKEKSLTAVLWSGADVFLRQGLQLIISIVLARILTPEEFGSVALLYLFTGIASTFIDGGFSAALVQRQDITHTDESTVFWFNLVMGITFSALLWFIAGYIAGFYNLPILEPLTQILGLSVFVTSLGSIHHTLLIKKLDFKTPMKISAFTTIISGACTIWLASEGFGVWALVVQSLVSSSVTTILLWVLSDWRPRCVFSLQSVRRLFGFGGYLMIAGLLDTVYSRLYTLLIGKLYGVRELGLYNRAENTKQIPVEALSGMLSKIAFPIFSQAAEDKDKLRRGMSYAIRGIMLVNVPMMLGLFVTAESLVEVVYGEQWLPAVPILQILCLGGILWPLHIINLNVLKAQGHSHLFFRLEVIKKVLGTALLIGGAQYGAIGIAWSQVIFSVIAFFINAYYTRVYLNYGPFAQIWSFMPIAIVSLTMSALVFQLEQYEFSSVSIMLASQVAAGAVVFILVCQLFRVRAFKEFQSLVLQGLGKSKR